MTEECRPTSGPWAYTITQLFLSYGGQNGKLPTGEMSSDGLDISSIDLESTAVEHLETLIGYDAEKYDERTALRIHRNWDMIHKNVAYFSSLEGDENTSILTAEELAAVYADANDQSSTVLALRSTMGLLEMMARDEICETMPSNGRPHSSEIKDDAENIYTISQLLLRMGGDKEGGLSSGELPEGGLDISSFDWDSDAVERLERLIDYDHEKYEESTATSIQKNWRTIRNAVDHFRGLERDPNKISATELKTAFADAGDRFSTVLALKSSITLLALLEAEPPETKILNLVKTEGEPVVIPVPEEGWPSGALVRLDGSWHSTITAEISRVPIVLGPLEARDEPHIARVRYGSHVHTIANITVNKKADSTPAPATAAPATAAPTAASVTSTSDERLQWAIGALILVTFGTAGYAIYSKIRKGRRMEELKGVMSGNGGSPGGVSPTAKEEKVKPPEDSVARPPRPAPDRIVAETEGEVFGKGELDDIDMDDIELGDMIEEYAAEGEAEAEAIREKIREKLLEELPSKLKPGLDKVVDIIADSVDKDGSEFDEAIEKGVRHIEELLSRDEASKNKLRARAISERGERDEKDVVRRLLRSVAESAKEARKK